MENLILCSTSYNSQQEYFGLRSYCYKTRSNCKSINSKSLKFGFPQLPLVPVSIVREYKITISSVITNFHQILSQVINQLLNFLTAYHTNNVRPHVCLGGGTSCLYLHAIRSRPKVGVYIPVTLKFWPWRGPVPPQSPPHAHVCVRRFVCTFVYS